MDVGCWCTLPRNGVSPSSPPRISLKAKAPDPVDAADAADADAAADAAAAPPDAAPPADADAPEVTVV